MTRVMFVLIILAFSFLYAGFVLYLNRDNFDKYDNERRAKIEKKAQSYKKQQSAESKPSGIEQLALKINEDNVDEFLAIGKSETDKGNYQEALKYYNAIAKAVPDNKRVYSNRAAVKMYLKDYHGAIEDCDISINIAPKRMNGYINRASSKLETGDYDGAIADAEIAISNNEFLENAYSIKASAEYNKGNYAAAAEAVKKVFEINPERQKDGYYQRMMEKIKNN